MDAHLLFEHWLLERPDRKAVRCRQQMDRAAQCRRTHDAALGEKSIELIRIEPLEPRPQRDMRVGRHLRLQPDEVLDRRERVEPGPGEQQLAGERGAVQRPIAEQLHGGRAYAQACWAEARRRLG